MSVERWEYRIEDFSLTGSDCDYYAKSKLSDLGAQGWELVAVVDMPKRNSQRAFLKKRRLA